MPGKFESFKNELEELGRLIVKLIIHCIVLLVILLFILLITWIHQLFHQNYSELARPESCTWHASGAESNRPEDISRHPQKL